MKRIWPLLNSPLIVLLIAFALWPCVSAWEHRIAVRSTFTELNRSAAQMNDRSKQSGIKMVVSSVVSQFVDGFTSAFDSIRADQATKLSKFNSTLSQVSVSDVRTVPSQFPRRQKVIGSVHNGSSEPISDIRINLMLFAADGGLIDVADKSLHEIKLLQPGQTIGFAVDRSPGASNEDKTASDTDVVAKVTAQIVGFDVQQPDHK